DVEGLLHHLDAHGGRDDEVDDVRRHRQIGHGGVGGVTVDGVPGGVDGVDVVALALQVAVDDRSVLGFVVAGPHYGDVGLGVGQYLVEFAHRDLVVISRPLLAQLRSPPPDRRARV